MLTLPHSLVAAALVRLFPNPLLSLPLAFISHFIMDFFIIHWNPHLYTEYNHKRKISKNSLLIVLIDGAAAISFCFFILFKYWPSWHIIAVYAAAIFLATLPDTIEIPYYFLGSKSKLLKKYVEFEHKHQANGSVFWGIVTQAVVISITLIYFFY